MAQRYFVNAKRKRALDLYLFAMFPKIKKHSKISGGSEFKSRRGLFTFMADQDKNLSKNQYFFNKWAKSYDRLSNQYWMKRFQLPVFKELQLYQKTKTKILDISCGTGELLKKLEEKTEGKAMLYGADLSEEMLNKARSKLSSKVKLGQANVHALPFKDNSFDYVISTEAFHHYYDQQKAVQEMQRVAKEGGKVIIVDINFFLKLIHWLFKKFEPGHVKINSRKEMRQLFELAGLKNIRQRRNFLFAIMTVGEK